MYLTVPGSVCGTGRGAFCAHAWSCKDGLLSFPCSPQSQAWLLSLCSLPRSSVLDSCLSREQNVWCLFFTTMSRWGSSRKGPPLPLSCPSATSHGYQAFPITCLLFPPFLRAPAPSGQDLLSVLSRVHLQHLEPCLVHKRQREICFPLSECLN